MLTVLGIMFGGTFLLRISTCGTPFNALQKSFFRAGHAHAGLLVLLGLVCALLQGAAGVDGAWQWSSVGVLTSALLIPGGSFSPSSAKSRSGQVVPSACCGREG